MNRSRRRRAGGGTAAANLYREEVFREAIDLDKSRGFIERFDGYVDDVFSVCHPGSQAEVEIQR